MATSEASATPSKNCWARFEDPVLRAKFRGMLDCPIKDSQGRCHTFTGYILSTLVRHQIHRIADVEEALNYIYQTMMFDKKINGAPKATVFGSFNFDRDIGSGNPLEARFKTAVANAVSNIASGRIRRLLHTPSGTISADEIPCRTNHDQAFGELMRDISGLLAKKEKETRLPLAGLFHSMISGEPVTKQRRLFGNRAAVVGRGVILQTIKDFAHHTGDVQMLGLLSKIDQPNVVPTASSPKAQPATTSPKERDYASILAVIDRLERPVGSADLGRLRRRWLEYPPREITGASPKPPGGSFAHDVEGRGSPNRENRQRSGCVSARRTCRGVSAGGGGGGVMERSVMLADAWQTAGRCLRGAA